MAHFARIENNNVIEILVVANEQEHRGQDFLANDLGLGGEWLQTSYNTRCGIYIDPELNRPADDQSKAFRGNFAQPGYSYDPVLDAFIPPKPFESWILNETSYWWEAPVAKPVSDGLVRWDEPSVQWVIHVWDEETQTWNPPIPV